MVCCIAAIILASIFLILSAIKIYVKLTTKWCESQTCLVGKTAIVTGANTGLGYETALDLAKRGAKVILACRNQQKADEAKSRIIHETNNENIVVKIIDMESLESVRAFAEDINSSEDRLDILVNNAGAVSFVDSLTKDGLQTGMQVNYFSPFLLTILLLGLLRKTGKSRIVNVASMGAKRATTFDVAKINQFPESSMRLYFNTKLCNIFFTVELAARLVGTNTTTYSIHPGLVSTDIMRKNGWVKTIWTHLGGWILKCARQGAQTQIYASVANGIENLSGEHFIECRRVEPYATALDKTLPKKLWEATEKLVKLTAEEKKILPSRKII